MPVDSKLNQVIIGGSNGGGGGSSSGTNILQTTPTTQSQSKSSSSSSSGNGNGSMSNAVMTTTPSSAVGDWFKKKTETAFKKVNRLEEKISQAIGKAQKTEDEQLESYVNSFEQQYLASNLIQKELQRYISSLKETQKFSKNFYECLKQIYEPSWPQYNELIIQCQLQEQYWNDLLISLNSNISTQIQIYNKEFPEYKKQIEKRDNKLLDYDKARHTLEDLETSKKPDEMKIHRARLDLQEKQRLYNDLNSDLHSKLPVLYETRKYVYGSTLRQLFSFEREFHESMLNSKSKLENICGELYEMNKTSSSSSVVGVNGNLNTKSTTVNTQSDTRTFVDNDNKVTNIDQLQLPNLDDDDDDEADDNGRDHVEDDHNDNNNDDGEDDDDEGVSFKCLYKVKATYPYDAKEIDELTFLKDDVIEVVECTESEKEELDDGWLIGIHEITKKRGLFPENFTKRL